MLETTATVVTLEPDPTPLVLSVATRLRRAAADPALAAQLQQASGTVSIISSADPQTATLEFAGSVVHVRHGADVNAPCVSFDPEVEFEVAQVSGSDSDEWADALNALLNPPVSSWRDAAEHFWNVAGTDPGMPSELVVVNADDGTEARFGQPGASYTVRGTSENLSAVLSGNGNFIVAAASGLIDVVGTLPQLSVMCGAHWKVKFHG